MRPFHPTMRTMMKIRDDDLPANVSTTPDFLSLLSPDAGRRRFLRDAAVVVAMGATMPRLANAAGGAGGAGSIPVSTDDLVRVPPGHSVQLLFAWGDPVSDGPAFRADAGNSAADQAQQAGMHHDGLAFFPFVVDGRVSSTHGLLCVNHEYTDEGLLHPDGMASWTAEKMFKSQNAHGVSVVEVRRAGKGWEVVRPSAYARRITARTPIRIAGPAASSPALRTRDDRRGNVVFGTIGNCAMGVTPWGTYLTCEENFSGYFNGTAEPTAAERRYGIRRGGYGYRWHEHDGRFDVATEPNEPNRFGWVVEIDPRDPRKPPVKRTALGRFKHEGATVTLTRDRRVAVYMGDDEAFEYIYKFVSRDAWGGTAASGANLLDHGTLYVARFLPEGKGEWVELTHGKNGLDDGAGFAEQADVLVQARLAADRVGATKMDRPEQIAVDPRNGEVYCSLTRNDRRDASDADAANPRAPNPFGHIVRWREADGDAAAVAFAWDIFLLGGDPAHPDDVKRGTMRGDAFANPDGLWFDPDGRLWVQTDVSPSSLNRGEFAAFGNNQMLLADTVTGEVRRFLTGPRGCEITGIARSPDGRNLFVNIQHPGEIPGSRSDPARPTSVSSWPAGQFPALPAGRPRSATVVITRDDGGVVGA